VVNISTGAIELGYTSSVVITLNETAEDSGIFNIQTQGADDGANFIFNFSWKTTEAENSINLTPGGNVTAYVMNDSGVDGVPSYTADSLAVEPNNATFQFMNNSKGLMIWKFNHSADTITIRIDDNGMNFNESLEDRLNITMRSSLGEVINFMLNESTVNSGIFNTTINGSGDIANISFTNTTGASSNASLTLSVSESQTTTDSAWVRFYYDDILNFDGTAPAEMYNQTTIYDYGSVAFTNVIYTMADNLTVTVIDFDLNASANTGDMVNVSAWAEGVAGNLTFTLNESTQTSGTFNQVVANGTSVTGSTSGSCTHVNFSSYGSANNCTLNVLPGAKIYVNYTDGNPYGIRNTSHAYMDMTASVTLVNLTDDVTTSFSASDTLYVRINDTGNNTRLNVADSVMIRVNSSTDGGGIYVNVSESGVDTGLFNTSDVAITFSTSASSNATNTLLVTAGDMIWVEYEDYQTETDATSTVVNTTSIHESATITLNQAYGYNVSSTIIITVDDSDANMDPYVADFATVTIYSDSNSSGISCVVNESGVNTGVFNISTFTFQSNVDDEGACALGVDSGDTIYVRYEDNETATDERSNVTDSAVINIQVTLNSGWDLFSTPYTLDASWDSVANVFGGIDVNKTSAGAYLIYSYNGSSGLWSALASTDNFEPLNGYAVKMNAEDTVYLTPKLGPLDPSVTTPTVTVIMSLYTGYNFIGSNYVEDANLTTALNTLAGSQSNQYYWNHILEYDTNQFRSTTATTDNLDVNMLNGSAYWIYMNTDKIYEGLELR